jgi:hypothetical protein
MLKYLRTGAVDDKRSQTKDERHQNFATVLQKRISDTCEAHLNWLISVTESPEQSRFEQNYWADGSLIDLQSQPDIAGLSSDSLTNTPFQLLKFANAAIMFNEDSGKSSLQTADNPWTKDFSSRLLPWLQRLDTQNKRGFFAFPRMMDENQVDYQEYRLDEHIWIWRVLRAAEVLGLDTELRKKLRKKTNSKGLASSNISTLDHSYSTAEFEKQVLARFTTTNEFSSHRMLAVTRSPFESIFQFRSRHTALFYEENMQFFTKSSSLWAATIAIQRSYTKNQELRWDNPLRYALALMMGTKGHQIDSTPSSEMVKRASHILLDSSSRSGIFPGYLNRDTKEPEMFPRGCKY